MIDGRTKHSTLYVRMARAVHDFTSLPYTARLAWGRGQFLHGDRKKYFSLRHFIHPLSIGARVQIISLVDKTKKNHLKTFSFSPFALAGAENNSIPYVLYVRRQKLKVSLFVVSIDFRGGNPINCRAETKQLTDI